MRHLLVALLGSVLLITLCAGCGGNGKKNANSGRDMPRPAESP